MIASASTYLTASDLSDLSFARSWQRAQACTVCDFVFENLTWEGEKKKKKGIGNKKKFQL